LLAALPVEQGTVDVGLCAMAKVRESLEAEARKGVVAECVKASADTLVSIGKEVAEEREGVAGWGCGFEGTRGRSQGECCSQQRQQKNEAARRREVRPVRQGRD
jgi:hypothetical protein